MSPQPSVIVFDVNETLSDLGPMATRFTDVGAPEHLAKLWFATVLRDGFALTAAGAQRSFADLGVAALRSLLPADALTRGLDEAVDHVMSGFGELQVHPDVVDGIHALRGKGYRLVTLSNGAATVAERLLTDAGVRDEFEHLLSVEDAGAWKPARAPYDYAARVCGTSTSQMLLVAVHPWDTDGAARAGLSTAWLNRSGGSYPDVFTAPTWTASSLPDLAGQLPSRT